jgi:hypothetical protein
MVWQVENSTSDPPWQVADKMQMYQKYYIKLLSDYMYKVCETEMGFMFKFGSHLQYTSLSYANIPIIPKYFG